MTERPILMSVPMVRALLAGSKTQTRRIVKPQPPAEAKSAGVILSGSESNGTWWWLDDLDLMDAGTVGDEFRCPYGVPGDELWCRESWRVSNRWDGTAPRDLPPSRGKGLTVMFGAGGSRAHDSGGQFVNDDSYPETLPDWAGKLRPGIHMPRWASRITLRITDVRVERLQTISEEDAMAEGIVKVGKRWEADGIVATPISAVDAYKSVWQYINGPGSWDANPWVFALTFERVDNVKEQMRE